MRTEVNVLPLGNVVKPTRPRVKPTDHADLPFIGMEHVEAHSMRLLGTVPASTMKSSAVHFMPGDVIYGRLRPYLNKVYRPSFEGLCSAEFIVLPENERVDGAYLQYFLNSSAFVRYASQLNSGDRPRVDFVQLAPYPIPLPPKSEQHRVVAEIEKQFSRLDEAVADLKRVKANLKRYRAAVLRAAVTGRLVDAGEFVAATQGSTLLDEIRNSRRIGWEKHFETVKSARYREPLSARQLSFVLPGHWAVATLDELTPPDRPSAYGVLQPGEEVGEGVRFIRVGDVNDGQVDVANLKRISPSIAARYPRTELKGGELLITLVGTIGRTAIVPPDLLGANVARAVAVVPLTKLVDPNWIMLWFQSPDAHAQLERSAHEVARKTLNLEDVRQAPVGLPPLHEQRRIVAIVERHLSQVRHSLREVDEAQLRAKGLRETVLASVFTRSGAASHAN